MRDHFQQGPPSNNSSPLFWPDPCIDKESDEGMLSTFTMSILLGIFTFILILISIFLVLLVLMQKSKGGGMGAALGGGATEAAFGADTDNMLSKLTINMTIAFFILAFLLYLGHIYQRANAVTGAGSSLPTIEAPAAVDAPVPAEGTTE